MLKLKNKSIELVLQHLVGVINAQLLETIRFEKLKSENVKDANEILLLGR